MSDSSNKSKKLIVSCKNHRDLEYTLEDDEVVRQVGATVYITRDAWGRPDPVFVYTLESGDAWCISTLSEDEELINRIADLDKEDLEKIRNFCVTTGLLK